jgi:predicted ATP-dependent protease
MAILPTILSAIGSGLGIMGMSSSANASESIANLNYQIARYNAEGQRRAGTSALNLERIGIRSQMSEARTNLRLSLADAAMRERNAQRLRLFAEAKTKSGQEAMRRQLGQFDEFRSRQKAAVAASGVTISGSPLEVMAETAAQMKLSIQDMADETAFQRDEILNQATIEALGAFRDRTAARATFGYAKRGTSLALLGNRIGRQTLQSQYRSGLMGAELARLQGYDQAAGTRMSAFGSAFSATGNLLTGLYQDRQLGAGMFRP